VVIEIHLTLATVSQAEPTLEQWALAHGCRVTCIELDRGLFKRQVMLTTRVDCDTAAALRASKDFARALHELNGVELKRTKLEIMAGSEARSEPGDGLYLEHHVKVRLSAHAVPGLARLGSLHAAHLSRNAFRQFATHEERFLTQRFGVNESQLAAATLDALVSKLDKQGYDVMKVERELVILDDNLALDDGWAGEHTS
jgi:hypothetical protein